MTTLREPQLADVLRAALLHHAQQINVALPGRVEKYDAATQKADVKPLIKRNELAVDGSIISESLPVVQEVPVIFPRAGDFFLSMPVKQGDHVLLVFCSRSIDIWAAGDGGETDPADPRTHDLSDAVAIPGLWPFSSALGSAHADNIVIGNDNGVQIHITDDTINLGEESAAEPVAMGDKTDDRLSSLQQAVDDIINKFNGHTHMAGTLLSGPPGGPVTGATAPVTASGSPVGSLQSVGAEKAKVT